MAKFKAAFVAITLFFCLFQNGGAQQYEDRLSQSVGDWQPRRSRLKSKPATRSVATSPEAIPNYSSLDVTTRSRQRTRGRNIPDPLAVPQQDAFDTTENQRQQFLQDPSFRVDLPRERNDDFRGSQQRTNIKTLEDSLNTEKYQKRIERPQNSRRKDFSDQTDAPGPADFRRNKDAEVESLSNRAQRSRLRVSAERRIGTSNYVAGGEVQNRVFVEAPTDFTAAPRSRGNFRGRANFQDAPTANKEGEAPKRGRGRVLTSRYRNVDAPVAVEDAGGRVSAAELEAARTLLPGSTVQYPPADQFPFVQQVSVGGGVSSASVLHDVQVHQPSARQNKGRSEAVFPNLSTQQFSTDATQVSRLSNDVAPTTQEFLPGTGQQFPQGNQEIPVQSPNLRAPLSDGQLQQIPDGRQFPGQASSAALQPNQHQILRRIDGNEVERTPQFIPVEAPKSRNNFRSRARTASSSTSTQGPPGPEISTQSYDAQQGRSRSRQGAFRSRTRPYAITDETATTPTPPATPSSRSRIASKAREDSEDVPPRNIAVRGRSRSQSVETRPSLEAKERMFEEELPETEINDQANQNQYKNSSKSGKPFRGTVTARVAETQWEDDVDSTENYPKEFLEKLKSSKGFVPPPKRTRQNSRTVAEPTFTPTTFNAGTARLKRKQFTTETYSRRDSDLSETTKRESETRAVTQSPENDKTTERSTTRQTRERYSQRFYRKLASKATGGGAGTSAPTQAPTEPGTFDEESRSKTQVRKTFKSSSTTARPSTTEVEVSTAEEPSSGEERRRFVPKKKITLEERKLRIAKLKEKLRQNATEGELKAAESQESFVVKEALVVQANTHPGSREIYDIQEQKSAVQAKSSTSSNAKRARGKGARGETKLRDDLVTLGSEENVQAVFLAKNESSTTTKKPKAKKTRTTPTTTPSTTVRESGLNMTETSTTSRPQAATQVPISTTSKPDFAVLNVTLFPSTRHRFSARINSSASIILPPDVELITTTAPSVALNAPENTTALERQPDFTFSVNKLFNSSLATTTSASVERATTNRNSFGTALFNPGTQSLSPGTTTQKSSTTTKHSSSKKKSSGRKKSKKSKNKTSGNGTTTKRPTPARVSSTPASTATVRTAPVNSTGNASNSNSTGVRPLSLAFSDFEGVFNETMKVVNNNPMAGPLPGVVPRAELDALTPETILNRMGTEDATEGATAKAETATSSNPISVDNSTNQVESPGRLTSEVECTNGSCKNSKSQSVHFNAGANDARAPLPYARRGGTTKSPETLRRIFIYGIFPNNTVQRKPFPGDGDDQGLSARQYSADRYYVDRYNPDSYNANRYNPDRYNGDRYSADLYSARGRPTTSIPPYTPGDYYVFGVYPNNSVVRRRGWKTFDYEKYHSPYVIFGIYPNNTIIKKYPNGTTIDDEFMVSDNEITRKTISDGNVYRGCSCTDGAHHHVATPGVQTTEGTTPKTTLTTTTSTTTTTTTTTMKAPEESDVTEPEDSATEAPEEPDETETEEPERNAKDDAENIDFGLENISETDQPQTGISDENPTTTEGGVPEDEREEEGEDEEEEEQQSEGTTESSLEESPTTMPVSDVTETTTQSFRGSLSEAEEADTSSTTEAPEESTTTTSTESGGSEGLENAEEADNASTPANLEEATNSLEREETQNAKGSGTLADAEEADSKGSSEQSGAGGLAEAEEADNSKIAEEGTETSAIDATTNILEKEMESADNVSETNRITEDHTEETFPSTEKSEDLQERTTAKGDEDTVTESSEIAEENTGTNSDGETTENYKNADEGTTERNLSEEGTLEEKERLVESTTVTDESLEDKNLSEAAEREQIQERTTQAGEYPDEYSTERRENLYETTTEGNSSDRQDKSTEESENSTTQKGETTTETYFGDADEAERENVEDGTTERNERILESTTELNAFRDRLESLEEPTTEENDNNRIQTTESNENSLESSTEENSFSERPEYFDERTTEESENSRETATENMVGRFEAGTTNRREDLQESTTEGNLDYEDVTGSAEETTEDENQFKFGGLVQSQQLVEGGTTESGEATETPASTPTPSPDSDLEDREAEGERSTENSAENDVSSSTEETSSEENFIVDLNSDLGSTTENPRLETSTESSAEADAVDEEVGELSERESTGTEVPERTTTGSPEENTVSEERFEGYSYERPTESPFDIDDLFGGRGDKATTPPTEEPTEEATEAGASRESSTTDYDIDVRELGSLISRLTTRAFVETTTTEKPEADSATDDLLNALPPPGGDDIRTSASGALVKRRDRRAVDELDEPSSLTKLAYRALSSSETTSTPIPVLTTTTTTTTTMTSTRATASPPRAKPKKVKNLSKTSVTAYKNLTNLTSTPLPDEVFIVTPVSSTRGHSDADYFKRGKVKFVTLTPGVVVTTNVRDENDILTMSSQHVQKVTKAPAKIPDNFLSTVFGEIEEKASSPIPDILKNVQNDLQGDGLSASLARRIITLALEKAMTSTTPQVTPQAITATTIPVAVDSVVTTSIPQTTASYIQRITTAEPIIPTTTKKPVTTKKPNTTTKKPTTTTKKPKPKPITTTSTTTSTTTVAATITTTRKPFSSSTTRRPRTTSTTSTTTTTETPQTILITPKKSTSQQAVRNPTGAITSPEFLGSTSGPEIVDGRAVIDVIPSGIDPLRVLFPDAKTTPPTTTISASQRVTEDLNVLLSGLWQEQSSTTSTPSESFSNLVEPKKKSSKSKSVLSKQASASLSESDLKILEAILQQQGAGGAAGDLEQIVQNQIRLAEEVRKASRNLKKKQRTTTTTTTERATPLGLGFLLNLFGAGSRPNGLFSNEQRIARRPRPVLASYVSLNNATGVTPDPFNELDEGGTTGERSARGELVSAAIDVTKAVSKFMGTVLTSAAQSFQNFFRSLGR